MKNLKSLCVVSLILILSSCAGLTKYDQLVSDLRADYDALAADPKTSKYAPVALEKTGESLEKTEKMLEESRSEDKVSRQIYVTELRLDTLREKIRDGKAQESIENAEARRKDILIDARTADANEAKRNADLMRARALEAERKAEEFETRAKQLEGELSDVSARQTDRGIVLTLDDILFEVSKSDLHPGSERSLMKISEFLANYKDRELLIEGHTDSTGEASFNQDLSERRAVTVKSALVDNGVDPGRISTKGFGEELPVAPNDTRTGRQQNRRVEVVILNPTEQ